MKDARKDSHAPKFGDWQVSEDLYTQYFETKKGRGGGKPGNPSEPTPSHVSPARASFEQEAIRNKNERSTSRESSNHQRSSNSIPQRKADGLKAGMNISNPTVMQGNQKPSAGSDRSIDNTPLDPRIQSRVVNSGGPGSSSWLKLSMNPSNHGSSPTTAGRSKIAKASEQGATIPQFGKWDPKDPKSSEDFTDTFKRLRDEMEEGASRVPSIEREPRKPDANFTKCYCCPWFGK